MRLGRKGLDASASGSAFAGVRAEGNAKFHSKKFGGISGKASGSASAGVYANGDARLKIDKRGASLKAKGEIGAAVRAGGEASIKSNAWGIGGSVHGGVSAGASAKGHLEASLRNGRFKANIGGGLTALVGGDVGGSIDIDTRQLAKKAKSEVKQAANFVADHGVKAVKNSVAHAKKLANLVKTGWMKTFKLVEIAEDSEQRSEHQSMEQQVLTHLKIIQRAWVNDVHTEQGAKEFIYILAHRDDGKVDSAAAAANRADLVALYTQKSLAFARTARQNVF